MKLLHKNFLTRNLVPICQGANVWDFCCGTGMNGLFALEHGAEQVTFSDVRQQTMLDYAKQIPTGCVWKYFDADQIDQYKPDIPTDNLDIILYCGHFYHARNHYEIAKMLTATSAQHLIIETKIYTETDAEMIMTWSMEDTEEVWWNTFEEGKSKTLVGAPNKLLTEHIFTNLGWKLTDQESEFDNSMELFKHYFLFTKTCSK